MHKETLKEYSARFAQERKDQVDAGFLSTEIGDTQLWRCSALVMFWRMHHAVCRDTPETTEATTPLGSKSPLLPR